MKTVIPHALPYVAFVGVGSSSSLLGDWTYLAMFVVTGLLLLWFWRRGDYPELRVSVSAGQLAAAVAAGLAIAAVWVPLGLAVPPLPMGGRDQMELAGMPLHAVSARVAVMVVAGPVMEELLVRSAIPRLFDAAPGEDWRTRPIGVFTRASAAASLGFFTISHPEWLAALVTGIVWTWMLARSRNLLAIVISHCVANLGLAGYILVSGDTRWW